MKKFRIHNNQILDQNNKLIGMINGADILGPRGDKFGSIVEDEVYDSHGKIISRLKEQTILNHKGEPIGSLEDARKLIDSSDSSDLILSAVWMLFFVG